MTWETARRWALPALERAGEHTEAEVLEKLSTGHAILFEGEDSAFVVSFVEPHNLHAWLVGGVIQDVLRVIPGVEAYGRAHGANYATLLGRPGWERALKPLGYVREGDELRKPLR